MLPSFEERHELSLSPAEVCELFKVAKSTLFRWESEGVIPPVPRDEKDRRVYTLEHVAVVARRVIKDQFQAAFRSGDLRKVRAAHERLTSEKVLEGDPVGFSELNELKTLTPETIRALLAIALRLPANGPELAALIAVIHRHLNRRVKPTKD